jgi:hypothetical protein
VASGKPALLLTYSYMLENPPRVHQNLSLYDNGQAWYWATLPSARPGTGVGTYVFTVDVGTLAKCSTLAADLATLPVTTAIPVPDVTAVEVTAFAGAEQRTHQLGFTSLQDLSAPLAQAHEVGESLIALAEQKPLAVVGLACTPGFPAIGNRGRAMARFAFTNGGTHPVTFLLQPQSFAVQSLQDGDWQTCWRHSGDDHIGLIGPAGDLVDGFILPATLAPGDTATVVFLQALLSQEAGTGSLRGQVAGTISLLRRDQAPPSFPRDRFRLVSAPVTPSGEAVSSST